MVESFDQPSIKNTIDISDTITSPTASATIIKPITNLKHKSIDLNAIQILTMNHFEASQSEISRPVKLKTKFKSGFMSIIDKQIIEQQIIQEQLKRLNELNKDNDEIICLTNLFEENVLNEFAIELNKEDKIEKIESELNMMEMVDQIWKQEQTNIAMTASVFHETKPHRVSLVELNASIEIDKNLLNKYVNESSNSKVCSSVPIHKGSQDQLLFIQTLINKARKNHF